MSSNKLNNIDPNTQMSTGISTSSSNTDDTPMALLEQLVYIDNFLQSTDTPTSANDNFDDQLQRELAAFADDTFIFPDEDKPKKRSDSSGFIGSSDKKSSSDLLSYAEATSFNHISPTNTAPSSAISSQINQQHYQNLSQRYSSSNNNINNNNNNNNIKQKFGFSETPAIPSTIHELLGTSFYPDKNTSTTTTVTKNTSSNTMEQGSSNQVNSATDSLIGSNNNNNNNNVQTGKVQVPQGAQNTLAAAGLSQTQIEALASLIAYHKPDIYGNTPNHRQSSHVAPQQPQFSLQQPQHQQMPQLPSPQIGVGAADANQLLVNLLAQTLVSAVQPQQQNNLLSTIQSLVTALNPSATQTQAQAPTHTQTQQQQQQQPHDSLSLLLQLQQQQQLQQHQQTLPSFPLAPSTGSTIVQNPNSAQSPSSSATESLKIRLDKSNAVTPRSNSRNSKSTTATTPTNTNNLANSPVNQSVSSDPETDKKQRVTAASARFRIKKKLREQEMERSLKEASELSKALENRIQQLEMENRLLRNLVVEKSQQRDTEEVERLRKKAKVKVSDHKEIVD